MKEVIEVSLKRGVWKCYQMNWQLRKCCVTATMKHILMRYRELPGLARHTPARINIFCFVPNVLWTAFQQIEILTAFLDFFHTIWLNQHLVFLPAVSKAHIQQEHISISFQNVHRNQEILIFSGSSWHFTGTFYWDAKVKRHRDLTESYGKCWPWRGECKAGWVFP